MTGSGWWLGDPFLKKVLKYINHIRALREIFTLLMHVSTNHVLLGKHCVEHMVSEIQIVNH